MGPKTIADDILKRTPSCAIIGSLAVVVPLYSLGSVDGSSLLGAVAAVFHDILIVLGVFSILVN